MLGGSIFPSPRELAAQPARGCWAWGTPGSSSPAASRGTSDNGSRRCHREHYGSDLLLPDVRNRAEDLGKLLETAGAGNAGQLLGSLPIEANLP